MKKSMFWAFAVALLVFTAPFVYAADLSVADIGGIQANCQYFPNSHTYYCTEKVSWSPSGSASIQETDGLLSPDYPPGTTFAYKSLSGSFTGSNSPSISAGGNCNPKDVSIDITGKCEGTAYRDGSCSSLPPSNGPFQKHEIYGSCQYRNGCVGEGGCSYTASFATGETCTASGIDMNRWDRACSEGWTSTAICTATSYIQQEGASATCNNGARTYYAPCSESPSVRVNGMLFQYSGLLKDLQTATLMLGNLKPGANSIAMSAGGSGKFDYNFKWTEVTSPTGACASLQRTKAYHITSGNIYQSGESARIVEGKFTMKFDSASTDTSVSLLKDDTTALVSARISPHDGSNLKLELFDGSSWNSVAQNINPNTWYNFSLIANEASNTVVLEVKSAEYPAISRTFSIPGGSPEIKWISVSSSGAWLDNINIVKKNLGGGVISTYADDFESYTAGESSLYGSSGGFDNIDITNDLSIDSYPVTYQCNYNNVYCTDNLYAKSIVFKAKNNFESKNIVSHGAAYGGSKWFSYYTLYGSSGNIEINAKNIMAGNLDTSGQPFGPSANIRLAGDTIIASDLYAFGGCSYSDGGSYSFGMPAGSIYIKANNTNAGKMLVYSKCANFQPANGGSVIIESEIANISLIDASSNSGYSGGSGGSVMIKGAKANVSVIDVNGGDASRTPYDSPAGGGTGVGGNVTLTGKEYVNTPSISANGGNGYYSSQGGNVKVSTGKIVNLGISANGGRGYLMASRGVQNDASRGGSVKIYANSVENSVSVSNRGGNAQCQNTGGAGWCGISKAGSGGLLAIFNDAALGGTITLDNSGGNGADCASDDRPDCKTGQGTTGAYQPYKRTWPGFLGLNTTTYDPSLNTYNVKIKDLWTGEYVKERNSSVIDYTYNGTLIKTINGGVSVSKIGNALLGFMGNRRFDMALGKNYQLEITMSICNPFDEALCFHASDKKYTLPFAEY